MSKYAKAGVERETLFAVKCLLGSTGHVKKGTLWVGMSRSYIDIRCQSDTSRNTSIRLYWTLSEISAINAPMKAVSSAPALLAYTSK